MRGIFKSSACLTVSMFSGTIRYLSLNSLHCRMAADRGLLSKLRKQTGIPFINCKKALEKFDNDFDQAKKWLQEQAQKEGWARATKLQSRPMSQGLVAVIGDQKHATLLEVNCETDFVARNEKFISMVAKLAEECNSFLMKLQTEKRVSLNREELNKMVTSEQSTLADIVALNVGNMGENMTLRRADYIRASDDSVLCSYVHPSSSNKEQSLQLGKYGAVVELCPVKGLSPSEDVMNLKDLGVHLCQHIVGMHPKSIGKFSPESNQKQKDMQTTVVEELVDENEQNQTQTNKEEENDELLSQEFLLDSSMTVGELVYLNGAEVKDFVRLACGEELESESK